jgi:Na+/proline symporter
MKVSGIDLVIILVYFLCVILVGLWVSKRGAKNMESYGSGGDSTDTGISGA